MAMTIGKKLSLSTVLFTLAALVPFVILGIMAVQTAQQSFISSKFEQLNSIRGIKKGQIESFFNERQGDMGVLVETVGTLRKEAFAKLEAVQVIKKNQIEGFFNERMGDVTVLSKSKDVHQMFEILNQYHIDTNVRSDGPYNVGTNEYNLLYDKNAGYLNDYTKTYGYYDMFIICAAHGHVMYTSAKEKDHGTNLVHGPYKTSPLAKLWQKVVKTNDIALQDFEPYAPSNDDPSGFVGGPIKKDGQIIGVVALQLSTDAINSIMAERTGMGKTGEVYLVGQDKRMRSDSFLDPAGHSIKASFAGTIEKNGVDTKASREALAGKGGAEVILDYNGSPVLSAYDPLSIHGLTWAIIAEIDVAEAFSPVDANGEEFYAKYKEMYGYYDLFLLNPDGYAFYTVAKESDYQTNFLTGKFSNSNMGKLVKQVIDNRQFGLADFAPYAPSNNEPCAFIAQPVVHNGQVEIIVALQLSLEAINAIMQEREGLGKTGETYLIGSDSLMRSDSFLDPQNHTVKASFANPNAGSVKTVGAQEALSGKTDNKIIMDYNGNPVLSAYTPVKVGETTWALLAEIDELEVVSESVAAKMLLRRVWTIGIVAGIVIFLVVLLNVFSTRKLVITLQRIIQGLNDGSAQVAAASGQVSSASQQMAEGSSEQAASIEETSSSLEEMSSMIKQNAEHASQADNLMKDTSQVVGVANDSMNDLNTSMDEISKASEETSKIIKTIDEIAFQTNLLALNAAVEAARAGEAGAGFAVVADEVRNLAMRAAEAAKNTANLIEGTVKKVAAGSDLVTKTNDAFTQVTGSTSKVGELVGEISAASDEQSQGIEQINKATTEMEKVVQQNAANAEENASASEEMGAQAEEMKRFVGELVAMVGVGSSGKRDVHSGGNGRAAKVVRALTFAPKEEKGKALASIDSVKKIGPEQVIPMNEEDFKDF
jgi:methyl-accepting chemotaxis protein